jgi:hypothetical protein
MQNKTTKRKGSQSQILRNAIYRLWEQQYQGEIGFDEFYKKYMTGIIETVKAKLI